MSSAGAKRGRSTGGGGDTCAVLMAAQTKRLRCSADAFAEMMSSAREPGAFDGPIGAEETDPAVQKELDKIIDSRRLHLVDQSSSEDDYDYDNSDKDDDDDDDEDSSDEEAELPKPSAEPSPGSALRRVGVHFSSAAGCREMVKAFSFVYADGTEIHAGNIRGTCGGGKMIHLAEGEHIVRVCPGYRTSAPRYLEGMLFTCSSGRRKQVFGKKKSKAEKEELFNKVDANAIAMEAGSVLKSIGWDEVEQRITKLEAQSLDEVSTSGTDSPGSSRPVPSLTCLARRAMDKKVAEKSLATEEAAADWLQEERNARDARVRHAYKEGQRQVRVSPEAARVRQLREQLAKAELDLQARGEEALEDADIESAMTICQSFFKRSGIKKELKSNRKQNYAGACSYRDTLVMTSQAEEFTEVCSSPSCGALYQWAKVPLQKRCIVKGCATRTPSCGCITNVCKRCHDPVCERHAKDHELACCKEGVKCGWMKKEGRLVPEACGRLIKGLKMICHNCESVCCEACYDQCESWRCRQVWCKGCQKRCSGVTKPCCDDCSFHPDLWIQRFWT